MRLIIDTNRLAAALIKSSVTREIILSDKFELFSPDYVLTEIDKNREYLIKKARLKRIEFEEILITLLDHIQLIPFKEFKNNYLKAFEIMKDADPDDTPFLALGMSLNADGIWTEDKDFKAQNILKVYSTQDLLEMMEKL
jgi:putative PIN family toxin of toxin-antitoxin system